MRSQRWRVGAMQTQVIRERRDATSNLPMGQGSFQAVLTIDFSPCGICNIVDEPPCSPFDNGTNFTHSHHEDCAIHGLRIDTAFQVTWAPEPSPARPGAATNPPQPPAQPGHLQRDDLL